MRARVDGTWSYSLKSIDQKRRHFFTNVHVHEQPADGIIEPMVRALPGWCSLGSQVYEVLLCCMENQ